MEDTGDEGRLEALRALWAHFAARECAGYSPIYAAVCRYVADDDDLLELIREAPPQAHQPNVLLAAVHYLLLDGLDHPLADLYAGRRATDGVGPMFKELCLSQREAILALMQARRTQTNECGRSAVLALGLAAAASVVGEPLALLDAGTSAGVNLLFDRYRLDYGPAGSLGPASSPVRIECRVRSEGSPVPARLPEVVGRLGLDRSPVDLDDPDDVRWLLACVWPDTGRMERTRAAFDLARRVGVDVRTGDMVADLPAALDDLGTGPTAVVTSWAFAYLSPKERVRFQEVLAEESGRRPIAWVSAEGPGVVPLPEIESPFAAETPEPSVLGLTLFDKGAVEVHALALVHPHGNWVDWRASGVTG